MKKSMLAAALVAATVSALPASAQRVDTLAIRAHTRFLADDLLLGRGTGTEGEHLAAAYIASQLTRLGLEPLGANGSYVLPMPLKAAIIGTGTTLELTAGAQAVPFRHGRDFLVNTGGSGAFHDFAGPVVFAGPPANAVALLQKAGSFRGRVVAVTSPLGAAAPALVPALLAGGATGVIVLIPDSAQFDLYVRSRGDRRFYVDADVQDPVWQPNLPVLLAGPSLTKALLDGVTLSSALVQGEAGQAALDLKRTVRFHFEASVTPVQAANVAGILRGSDPALRDQLIVYTAHYDHLGVSQPDERGDSIYNGFSDNAAGVGMLLAIAEALRASPPARSVAFVFFTGEERGLLGSSFFAAQPPFALSNVRGVINLDAGAPPAPPLSWRIAGGSDSPLGATAAEVAKQAGWTATLHGASPNSDYWPFLARKIPAVFIIPGDEWENTTTAQRDQLRRKWDHYHQASDAWQPDFPFAGLGRYADYALRLGLTLAR